MLFLHNTSRVETDAYQNLLSEKGGGGFPYLAVLDADGDVLAVNKGKRTTDNFRKLVQEDVSDMLELKAKAATDDEAAIEFFMKRLAMGTLSVEQIKKGQTELKALTDDQKSEIEGKLIEKDVDVVMSSIKSRDPKQFAAAGAKLAAMKDAGRIPRDGRSAVNFWMLIGYYAEQEKDAELFQAVIDGIQESGAANDRLIEGLKDRLEKLKDKDGGRP